ncbi:MAG: protein kinase [Acidobacteria bacterium]|nr:protein kinase [Acidobacteriota bacterium]
MTNIHSGNRLGPYEVISRIGAGGMGEVWRARDTRLERDVAVKILPAEFASNAQLKLRFEREAKTISQLNHPHICVLHDVGEASLETRGSGLAGDPSLEPRAPSLSYLVMELIDGESLAERIAKGPLPLTDVLKYGAQIAEALDRAHRAGVVHRDLKPGNVMITKSGTKLLDFGLAKSDIRLSLPGSSQPPVAVDEPTAFRPQEPLTAEGTILGTFQYMAPEQLEGIEADPRTDIFALGCVLYEMATGKRAFDGKSKTSLIAQIVSGEPRPIRDMQPLTPPALEHVIARCLEKDPDDRWQSAHDVASELKWISEAGSQAGVITPLRIRKRRRDQLFLALCLITGLAAAGVLGYFLARKSAPKPHYQFTIPGIDRTYRAASLARISPDGSKVVFNAAGVDHPQSLWVRSLDSFEVRPVEGSEGAGVVSWSPDSRSIAFLAAGRLHRVDADGGPVQVLADVPTAVGIEWGPEGRILVGSTRQGIRMVPANGGAPVGITKPDAAQHDLGHAFPTFLPDGRRFLFITFTREPNRDVQPHRLMAASIDSPEIRYIGDVPSRVQYVAPGYLLFVRNGILLAAPFDEEDLSFTGDPIVVSEHVYYFLPTGAASFSVSNNGILTVQEPRTGSTLRWIDHSGLNLGAFPAQPREYSSAPRFTADGTRLLAAVADPSIGTFDLWFFGVERETSTRLTYEPGWEASPLLSPDGGRIYYASDRSGVPDIYVKELDSQRDDALVLAEPGVQIPRDISPDGRYLLYATDKEPAMKRDLWVAPLEGDAEPFPFVRSPFAENHARFSPDGKWVSYTSDESGQSQVYIKPFPGPGPARQISLSGGTSPAWSQNGETLFYLAGTRLLSSSVSDPGEDPQTIFDNPDLSGFEVAPDGRRLLVLMKRDFDASPPTRVMVNWPRLLENRQ